MISKLVTREPHPTDRRYVVLALTPAGQKRYDSARCIARDFLAEKLAGIEEEQRGRMLEATRALKAIFSEIERQKFKQAADGAKKQSQPKVKKSNG